MKNVYLMKNKIKKENKFNENKNIFFIKSKWKKRWYIRDKNIR